MAAPARHAVPGRRLARLQWVLRGQVQGVGFRPFVYRLARRYRLTGWVENDRAGATVQVQGNRRQLARFERSLLREPPPLCRIQSVQRTELAATPERQFRIAGSVADAPDPAGDARAPTPDVTVDTAVCPACLAELLDPADRRHGYPLINCTQCGPRYSIVRRTPYDRCNTTMSRFEMCPACRREYADPSDRRFHAQPIACHNCGPRAQLLDPAGEPIALGEDPIAEARARLLAGQVVSVKGLGGYHLAARADRADVVHRLRAGKHRPAKPFAVMARNLTHARQLVLLSTAGEVALTSPQAPIVLAPRTPGSGAAACAAVAPGNHRLGVMLPYTPLHHLLLRGDSFPALVMTSANDCGEPLIIDNQAAIERLAGMCDALLRHDRPIERPVDDSVFLDLPDAPPLPVRRSRGFAPAPLPLPAGGELQGVAVGGELKSTVAVVRDGAAIVSQHLGDLSHPESVLAFRRAIDDLRHLFAVRPEWIAHDLHPAYASTLHARRLAEEAGVPLVPVQHHHAHAAALLAEHGLSGPALVVVCDGTGCGDDGTTWGGELLLADLCGYRRLAHLEPLRLPGGDASARDPRRCALAALHLALGNDFRLSPAIDRLGFEDREASLLCEMIRADTGCAASSGAGRLFDALAALLGICRHNQFEAQAAMALEAAAEDLVLAEFAPVAGRCREVDGVIDLGPTIADLVGRHAAGAPAAQLAAEFHEQFARAWAGVAARHARETGLTTIGLSGGVFCNALLVRRLTDLLRRQGLTVLRHERVPPNDGGIAYGQAAVAAARFAAHGRPRDRARKAGA